LRETKEDNDFHAFVQGRGGEKKEKNGMDHK
jgi:hypothetical protein